ncbi:MAG: hypothetical protein U9R53_02935 [Chloroflexota bacterium]|nr:hypothetical protein [Chloroflexota bacterium]
MNRRQIKKILGELPYTAELYWHLVQRYKPWQAHFNLDFLKSTLPVAVRQAEPFADAAVTGKKVFLFTSLHYWIEFTTMLAVVLAGQGHDVTFSFLPYASWVEPIQRFDLRKQNSYARQVLSAANSIMKVQSLLDVKPFSKNLSPELMEAVEQVSLYDAQYTLQVEDISKDEDIYKLRYQRNLEAAQNARAWLVAHQPDIVILPNGTIQEMGIVYRVAQHLGIPITTFEFSDQREHIWLAQNAEIMRHDTDELWKARGGDPLTDAQIQQLQDLFTARKGAKTWKKFSRLWQGSPTEGGTAVRKKLALDDRPVILLATNVLGDSLTLGRQVFSESMAEWIERTVMYFVDRKDVQLVIRVHPGETLTHGTSMVDVVNAKFDEIPDHIHLVKPEEKINTYDLLDITDLGLVYTTTVGLEMAMRGIPVVVSGKTHYRNRGFTKDPESWDDYFDVLQSFLADVKASRLTQEQVELSWRYAYLFFFVFPMPFPWRLSDLREELKSRPIAYVLSPEGVKRYSKTMKALTGKPLEW